MPARFRALRPAARAAIGLAVTLGTLGLAAPAQAASTSPGPAVPAAAASTSTTRPAVTVTTRPAPVTTITLPPPGPGPPIGGPPIATTIPGAPPTTEAPPPDPTPVLNAVAAGMSRLEALGKVGADKAVAATADGTVTTADAQAQQATQLATTTRDTAKRDIVAYQQKVARIAIAVYANPALALPPPPGSNAPDIDTSVVLPVVFKGVKQHLHDARQQLVDSVRLAAIAADLTKQAAIAHAQANAARAALNHDLALARGGGAAYAAGGPTIMGPLTVTGPEMAAWFMTTGHNVATQATIADLANAYATQGAATGVRADIAFVQSILETGWFSFPSGGQLNPGDNNFAGIGACDSCHHGWSFKDPQTGVEAQLELLRSYASTQPVPTPAIGKVGVHGCCPTWMSLTGVWATSLAYGVSIMTLYQQMLEWVIPQRAAAVGA